MRRSIQRPGRGRILALARKYTFAEAAARLGVHASTFARWYHDARPDRPRRPGPRPLAPPSREELCRVLRTHTNRATADHFGVSGKTLNRWLREYGIEGRRFAPGEMISLAGAARELNVSRMTLSNWFRDGLIPGARKLNGTRVMVPRSGIETIQRWRKHRETSHEA